MRERWKLFILGVVLILGLVLVGVSKRDGLGEEEGLSIDGGLVEVGEGEEERHPLSIWAMRAREYPGSEMVMEERLGDGVNYERWIAWYLSEGLKINGLLTIPKGETPEGGWPVIIFNHGYIPPEQYRTTERYVAYVDGFAKEEYVVFKPDYRGHGDSEGRPEGGYFSPAYAVDVLNAVASVRRLGYVNGEKIGMWGHSLGGSLVLRSMVVSKEVKVGVIWAGVVGSYEDIFYNWRRTRRWQPSNREMRAHRPNRQSFVDVYGEPKDNPEFWSSLSPIGFVDEVSGPVQLHHGTKDESVPIEFSEKLGAALEEVGKEVELYKYEGGDHNLSGSNFGVAMRRSVEFFDGWLK
jgi:dipeptidyl aminopeptidase/acylaminoacyl peptidase